MNFWNLLYTVNFDLLSCIGLLFVNKLLSASLHSFALWTVFLAMYVSRNTRIGLNTFLDHLIILIKCEIALKEVPLTPGSEA